MAYVTIARISGDPDQLRETYRRARTVMSGVGRDHDQIFHAAAEADDGLVIVNLWKSEADSEAAARDPRRLEVLEQSGIGADQFRREHHEVLDYELFEDFERVQP